MADSVGTVSKGIVVKDQGYVPYNAPEVEKTPSTEKGTVVSGNNRGMGAALRGCTFSVC
jgi:hypothetical protein